MFKRFIFAVFAMFVCALPAHSAQIVNVDYVHKIIDRKMTALGATKSMKINAADIYAAANMKYLLTAVDVANEIINGEPTTNYGTGEYATLDAADTVAANTAAETLIKKKPSWSFTTIPGTDEVQISIGASVDLKVDWGDNTPVQSIRIYNSSSMNNYSHKYSTPGRYTVTLTGRATDYNGLTAGNGVTAITIEKGQVESVTGGLGRVFPTLADGTQPMFMGTLGYQQYLTEIPEDLFDGVHGTPRPYMFGSYTIGGTFEGCSALKSIPENLFSGLSGAVESTFYGTFRYCTSLTKIPSGLFSRITGAANGLFYDTFSGCSGLTEIPSGLFSGITDTASEMFYRTFSNCSSLKSIPSDLFGNISGTADYMFYYTFSGCSSLTEIPSGLFANISGAASSMFNGTFKNCSSLQKIPADLFAGVSGTASNMFNSTFSGCSNLKEIPSNLFGDISGNLPNGMFKGMFSGCASLTGESVKIGTQFLYQKWPSATTTQVSGCYKNATGLTDWDSIPDTWK